MDCRNRQKKLIKKTLSIDVLLLLLLLLLLQS